MALHAPPYAPGIRPAAPNLASVATLTAVAALTALSIDLYLPSVPTIASDLGGDTADVQRSLSVFVLVFGMAQLGFGPLSDRFGRLGPLRVALVAYILGALLSATAGSIAGFVAGRVVQALGACGGAVSFMAMARDRWHGRELTRVLAWTTSTAALAPMLAPLLGSVFESTIGWRYGFVFLALYGGLVLIVLRGQGSTWTRRSVIEVATEVPSLIRPWRVPGFLRPALVHSLAFSGLFGYLVLGSTILLEQFKTTPLQFSGWFSANALVYAVASGQTGRLARRWTDRVVARGGSAVIVAGGLLMLGSAIAELGVAGFMVSMFVATMGIGLVLPASASRAMTALPTGAGQGAALLGFLRFGIAGCIGAIATFAPGVHAIAIVCLLSGATAHRLTRDQTGAAMRHQPTGSVPSLV